MSSASDKRRAAKTQPRSRRSDHTRLNAATRRRPERFAGERALKDRALDVASEGFTIADLRKPGQPLIYVNQGFERLTGYTAADALGTNCRFLQGPDTDPATRAEIVRAITERRAVVVEILNYRRDGAPFWNRLSLTPVRSRGGETTHYIGVQSDVTVRRQAEEQLREVNRQLAVAAERTRRDLEAASAVQRSLLPTELPALPGVRFAWSFAPSAELAGDVLGIVPLTDHEVGIYVIDVAGHGVTAALLSVTLSHWLEPARGRSPLVTAVAGSAIRQAVPPARVAEELSEQFPFDSSTALYFTMLYGVLDTSARRFRFVAAAHPAPVVVPARGAAYEAQAVGFPIGLMPGAAYDETTLDLEPGDRVLIVSDGLLDMESASGREFGMVRLLEHAGATRDLPLDEAASAILRAGSSWGAGGTRHDDISLVAFDVLA